MTTPIRVLELRSVRGTGGGPEKTILFGAARSDPARVSVTVCYIRDTRDDIFAIGDPAQDVTKYRVRFPRFELRDHTGSFYTANGASQVSYRAVKR